MYYFPKHKPDHASPLLRPLRCLSAVYRIEFKRFSRTLRPPSSVPSFLPFSFPSIVLPAPENQIGEIKFSWVLCSAWVQMSLFPHSSFGGDSYPPCKVPIIYCLLCGTLPDPYRQSAPACAPLGHNSGTALTLLLQLLLTSLSAPSV